MKTLRLLLFEDCNRSCEGCCNKQFDLTNLPVCKDFHGYDEILLTGGEPLLKPNLVLATIFRIRLWNRHAKIILYTAHYNTLEWMKVLPYIDGLTVTIHEQKDVTPFCQTVSDLTVLYGIIGFSKISLRLNVFKEVKWYAESVNSLMKFGKWTIKDNIEWIDPCPLPENEVFMKL